MLRVTPQYIGGKRVLRAQGTKPSPGTRVPSTSSSTPGSAGRLGLEPVPGTFGQPGSPLLPRPGTGPGHPTNPGSGMPDPAGRGRRDTGGHGERGGSRPHPGRPLIPGLPPTPPPPKQPPPKKKPPPSKPRDDSGSGGSDGGSGSGGGSGGNGNSGGSGETGGGSATGGLTPKTTPPPRDPEPLEQVPFTDEDNLRGTQFNPARSPRSAWAEFLADMALGRVAGLGFEPVGGIEPTDLSGARRYLGDAAGAVNQATLPGSYRRIGDMGAGREVRSATLPSGYERVNTGTYNTSEAADRARVLSAEGLEDLFGGPSRRQIAADTLKLGYDQTQDQFDQAVRKTGQAAAKFGNIGSGVTTSRIGDIFDARQERLDRLNTELSLEAAGLEMADRERRFGAALDASGQFTNEDLSNAGFRQGLRQERRGERAFHADTDSRRAQLALQRAGVLRGLSADERTERGFHADADSRRAQLALERSGVLRGLASDETGLASIRRGDAETDRSFDALERDRALGFEMDRASLLDPASRLRSNEDRADRTELRGERAYQSGLSQEAIENNRTRIALEEALRSGKFNRQQRRTESFLNFIGAESAADIRAMLGLADDDPYGEAIWRFFQSIGNDSGSGG